MKKLINISLSEIKISELTKLKSEALIVSFYESKKISDITDIFDKKSKGVIKKLISRNELSGSLGNKVYLPNLRGARFKIEYDSTDYEKEGFPFGRESFNFAFENFSEGVFKSNSYPDFSCFTLKIL